MMDAVFMTGAIVSFKVMGLLIAGLIAFAAWAIRKIKRLEQRCLNMEAEMFLETAKAELPGGEIKDRITLKGMVKILAKEVLGGKPKGNGKPLIHLQSKDIFRPPRG